MPESNPTESPERRRPRRRKDPEQQSHSPARQAAQPEEELGNPQPSGEGLQKDPSPSAVPDDGARFERVRQRAYELYVSRGDSSGDEFADWLEAERQIDAERR
jgi:hypothetical protein